MAPCAQSLPLLVAASRDYLKRNGAPETPQDRAQHDCIAVGTMESWVFEGPNGRTEVPARIMQRFRVMAGVPHAFAASIGLAPLPLTLFEEPAFKDVLVRVLTNFPLRRTTLYALYLSRKYVPLKNPQLPRFHHRVRCRPQCATSAGQVDSVAVAPVAEATTWGKISMLMSASMTAFSAPLRMGPNVDLLLLRGP